MLSLAVLEGGAGALVLVVVFLLALHVAVHYHLAVATEKVSWFEADWTDGEIRLHVFPRGHLIRYLIKVVSHVRIGSEIH